MISHWPFWAGALGLAGVAVLHWLVLGRLMAVSGSFSALVNRARKGAPQPGIESMAEDDLLAAVRAATLAEFGAEAVAAMDAAAAAAPPAPAVAAPAPRTSALNHTTFLLGLVLGGFLSAVLAGAFEVTVGLRSEDLAALLHTHAPTATLPLCAVGGVLVGFGTRMASGCTSGHGLCGVSRFQPGSLAATMAFFGTGIVVSFVIGALT
jgi:uncharacterized membrane protein YedE/YeeE